MYGVEFCANSWVADGLSTWSATGATANTWSFRTRVWALLWSVVRLSPSLRTPRNWIFRPSMPPCLLNRAIRAWKPVSIPL